MPTGLDILTSPEFAPRELTEAINVPPFVTGRLARLGVFTDRPTPQTFVRIGIKDGLITIIPARERGGPSNKNMRAGPGVVLLDIPHFPLGDVIRPSDLQNIQVFGVERVKKTLLGEINEKLLEMRAKHDATLHYMEWGAINGLVLDADGNILADLWDEFDVEQEEVDMALNTTGTDVAAKTRGVKTLINRRLRGAAMTGVRIFAGPGFYEKYVGHTSTKDAYKYYSQASQKNPQRDDVSEEFYHAGTTIERVDESFNVRLADGTFVERDAVADMEAIAIPLGTGAFKRFIAPPDTLDDANNAPEPENRVWVSTEPLEHGKGLDVHTESNVLPVCTQPDLMIKLVIET